MPVSQTAHTVITSYNAIRQNIANSRLLTERVRVYCETDHQQAMVEATNEYNAMLSTLSAVHLRLEEARENLVARQAEIQTQLRYRHAEIVRLEHEIQAMESEATDLLSHARLSSKERQLIVQNPFPILPTAPVYDVPLLERLYDTIYNALDEFEEQITKLRHERLWHTKLYRRAKPMWRPGRIAIALTVLYVVLFIWETLFLNGHIEGLSWLIGFGQSTICATFLLALMFTVAALRRQNGCFISILICVMFFFALIVWAAIGFESSLDQRASIHVNTHVYLAASRIWTSLDDDMVDYYVFQCDDTGSICHRISKNTRLAWDGENIAFEEVQDALQKPVLNVRVNNARLMHFSDCDTNCIETDDNLLSSNEVLAYARKEVVRW